MRSSKASLSPCAAAKSKSFKQTRPLAGYSSSGFIRHSESLNNAAQ